MTQGSLLPYLRDATRHAETLIGVQGDGLFQAARARAARELESFAAPDARPPAPQSVANAAAELLCLSELIEHASGEAPAEAAFTTPVLAAALAEDARLLGAPDAPLTQADVARALTHLKQLTDHHGIDLVRTLAVELKCSRLRELPWHAGPARQRAA